MNGLQLDHEAALIDLQEIENGLRHPDGNTEALSPEGDLIVSVETSAAPASESGPGILEDRFLDELRRQTESLKSRRTSFNSLYSMSDAASRHNKRLSQLLAED